MTMCPLCSERAGKRFCPAKDAQICAVCCGTKREVEIDCPASCSYLKASRSYEAEKRIPDAELAAKVQKYDNSFVYRYNEALNAISRAVAEEHSNSPWLVDNDVIEVYKGLTATMKTLSSGIYYESIPDGPLRQALFRRVKEAIDAMMEPDPNGDRRTMKVSEIIDVLDFLTFAAQLNSSVRPRSRRYLHWISEMSGITRQAQQSSGLIIP